MSLSQHASDGEADVKEYFGIDPDSDLASHYISPAPVVFGDFEELYDTFNCQEFRRN